MKPKQIETMPVFTLEAGRQIYRDGEPFISIGREGKTAPIEADAMARVLVRMMNGGYL
jgi:hypothetical protein